MYTVFYTHTHIWSCVLQVACMADGGGLPAASLGPCCMHAEGIMHHDCRLGNLLLKLAGHAWPLSDFGFAAPAAFQGRPNFVNEPL